MSFRAKLGSLIRIWSFALKKRLLNTVIGQSWKHPIVLIRGDLTVMIQVESLPESLKHSINNLHCDKAYDKTRYSISFSTLSLFNLTPINYGFNSESSTFYLWWYLSNNNQWNLLADQFNYIEQTAT